MGRRSALVLVAVACGARCATPTSIVVDVYSDVPCDTHAEVALVVGRTAADLVTRAPIAMATRCDAAPNGTVSRGRVVILPASGMDETIALQVVTRNDSKPVASTCNDRVGWAGCIVSRRQVSFVRNTEVSVVVHLRLPCLGVRCASDEVCVEGVCKRCTTNCSLCGSSRCSYADGGLYCADLTRDPSNCGTCGTTCAPDETCQPGDGGVAICACSGGRTDCGACVDLQTDAANCGGCGIACGVNEICSGGLCCASGETSCMGQCVDLQFNATNCGVCGFACSGNTPYCVGGKCATCNATVLLVMDSASSYNQTLAADLNAAGLPASVVDNGIESYSGSPNASSFGAIMVSGGGDLFPATDMPNAGQTAIVNAQQAGAGIVLVEPLQYITQNQSYLSTLSAIFLETGSTLAEAYDSYPKITMSSGHPIWTGITSPLDLNPIDDIFGMQGGTAAGATSIAQCSVSNQGAELAGMCSGDGTVLVKTGSGGRIAHFNATIMSSSYPWTNNANIRKMMVNALGWASTCK